MSQMSSYRMGPGRAFRLGAQAEAESTYTPVVKRWETIEGRTVLFEQIEWSGCEAMLAALPRQAQAESGTEAVGRVASLERRLPERRTLAQAIIEPPAGSSEGQRASSLSAGPRGALAGARPGPTAKGRESSDTPRRPTGFAATQHEVSDRPIGIDQVTAVDSAAAGVVLDYELVTGQTDLTFKGDTTYLVTGRVWLYGQTTFEGNAVIKFRVDNPSELPWLALAYGTVDCRTGPYRPVVFTAKDDNSVGDVIPGSSGNPSGYYAEYGLYVYLPSAAVELTHLQMRWFKLGLLLVGGSGHLVRHGQLVECAGALYASSTSFNADNLLMVNTHWRVAASNPGSIQGAHWTVDRAGYLAQMNGGSLSLVNSLLVGVTNWGYNYSTSFSAAPAPEGVFEGVGGGEHYLPAGSVHRNAGTGGINPVLLAELGTRTTEAPLVWGGPVNLDIVLAPVVQPDVGLPDLGYHYARLDYVLSGLELSQATLTLTNGVAVGSYGSVGVHLQNGAVVVSEGPAQALNRFVASSLVQEGSSGSATTLFSVTAEHAALPEVQLRFTEVSVPPGGLLVQNWTDYQLGQMVLRDCRISSARLHLSLYPYTGETRVMVVALTNNIFERIDFSLDQDTDLDRPRLTVHLRNNLFWRGRLNVADYTGTGSWTVRDNLFDQVTLSGEAVPNSHNGYVATGVLPGSGSGNVTVPSPADYVSGTLGGYYYPTSGGRLSLLLDAGSRSAATAGLYHYTVSNDLGKEAWTQVDIGRHYVATTIGRPRDTDDDGIPDYAEDANGNGIQDSGESSAHNPTSVLPPQFDGESRSHTPIVGASSYKCTAQRDFTREGRPRTLPDVGFSMDWGLDIAGYAVYTNTFTECANWQSAKSAVRYVWPALGRGSSWDYDPNLDDWVYVSPFERPPHTGLPVPFEKCSTWGSDYVYAFSFDADHTGIYKRNAETKARVYARAPFWPKPKRSVVVRLYAVDKTSNAALHDPIFSVPEVMIEPNTEWAGTGIDPVNTEMRVGGERTDVAGDVMLQVPKNSSLDVTPSIPCPWFQYELQIQNVKIVRLTWSKHPAVTPARDMQDVFDEGARLLARDDDVRVRDGTPGLDPITDDVNTYIEFIVIKAKENQFPSHYEVSPGVFRDFTDANYSDVTDILKLDILRVARFANVKLVKSIVISGVPFCGRAGPLVAGIVVANNALDGLTVAHEYGHTAALEHRGLGAPLVQEPNPGDVNDATAIMHLNHGGGNEGNRYESGKFLSWDPPLWNE